MAYIDTSVLVAYYCPEPLSKPAQQAIRRADPPTISPLVELELYSAVAAKVRSGDLDEAAAVRIITLLARHLAAEKNYKRIMGHEQLWQLKAKLDEPDVDVKRKVG
jgi:uncharacterized protein with PIN domain